MPTKDPQKRHEQYLRRKARLLPKICERCGVEYQPTVGSQQFCSRSCKDRKSFTCERCGTTFHNSHRRRFCSQECYVDSNAGRKVKTADGKYWRMKVVRGTPGRGADGRMLEHRWIMQEVLGRPLEPWETVHHINGDGLDNRLENLQLRQGRHGNGSRWVCLDCGSHNIRSTGLS